MTVAEIGAAAGFPVQTVFTHFTSKAELHRGQDLAVGYLSHDADQVQLYLEESLIFIPHTAETAIALTTDRRDPGVRGIGGDDETLILPEAGSE